jgi:hypothetical protein
MAAHLHKNSHVSTERGMRITKQVEFVAIRASCQRLRVIGLFVTGCHIYYQDVASVLSLFYTFMRQQKI